MSSDSGCSEWKVSVPLVKFLCAYCLIHLCYSISTSLFPCLLPPPSLSASSLSPCLTPSSSLLFPSFLPLYPFSPFPSLSPFYLPPSLLLYTSFLPFLSLLPSLPHFSSLSPFSLPPSLLLYTSFLSFLSLFPSLPHFSSHSHLFPTLPPPLFSCPFFLPSCYMHLGGKFSRSNQVM